VEDIEEVRGSGKTKQRRGGDAGAQKTLGETAVSGEWAHGGLS